MNKFNEFIEKGNFKKIFIIYIIVAIVCGAACVGTVGYAFRHKIKFALQYEKTSENLKRHSSDEAKIHNVDRLAVTSDDICDILLLDDENNVVYSAKKSDFASDNLFELKRIENSKFLQSGNNLNTVFRFVKKDEFMLNSVFADDFKEIIKNKKAIFRKAWKSLAEFSFANYICCLYKI